jgi:hypothetical protein
MYLINYSMVSIILFGAYGHLDAENVTQKARARIADTIPVTTSCPDHDPFFHRAYFSASDAEKILGEKAFVSDNSRVIKKDTLEYKSAYSAFLKDQKINKTGVVYFMIEQYSQDLSAKNAYACIKTANENHEGLKIVLDMGDEAYFQSDGQHFYFVLVRKGKIMFRIKVNKITSHTSLKRI